MSYRPLARIVWYTAAICTRPTAICTEGESNGGTSPYPRTLEWYQSMSLEEESSQSSYGTVMAFATISYSGTILNGVTMGYPPVTPTGIIVRYDTSCLCRAVQTLLRFLRLSVWFSIAGSR
ncbi:hypothetical protein C7212DRAFT_347744 [Tuber magnatum]|uniref:Uncharacterized protein n=1 Tax=Tuber magnatum TaxID=42249 RepID=A0A317SE31_9PEZI|nr:hypothetical protein C7212DRAFT_347744 [Tuber magnatum]